MMINIILLILFINSLSTNNITDEELPSFNYLKGYHLKGSIINLCKKSNMPLIVFYYNPKDKLAKEYSLLFRDIEDKYKYHVLFVYVDCSLYYHKETKGCEEAIIPDISSEENPKKRNELKPNFTKFELYFPQRRNINSIIANEIYVVKRLNIENSFNERVLYSLILRLIGSKVDKIETDDYNFFIDHVPLNKAIYFTNKHNPPSYFRALSNYYFKSIDFGFITKKEKTLFNKFNITVVPTIIVIQLYDSNGNKLDNPKVVHYKGNENTFELANFLEPYKSKLNISKVKKYEDIKNSEEL